MGSVQADSQAPEAISSSLAAMMSSSAVPYSPTESSYEHDNFQQTQLQPELVHILTHGSTVLALTASSKLGLVFAGTQDGEIVAWSLATFHQVARIQAHKRSVLSLSLAADGSLLFSSAGDPIVSAWCPKTLRRVHEIYSTYDVGDIFCTVYSERYHTLYLGAQNASIQWICLDDIESKLTPNPERHPDRRNHRFFDSKAIGGASTPRRSEDRWNSIPPASSTMEIDSTSMRKFAHNGYVYSMLIARGPTVQVGTEDEVLISAGGDGTIKLWSLCPRNEDEEEDEETQNMTEIMTLGEDDAESVLSLALDGSFLYAGKLDGVVELWDLDTSQKLRVIKANDYDITSVQMGWGLLWTAASDGSAAKYSTAHYGQYQASSEENVTQKYQCLARWNAHQGKILASALSNYKGDRLYITGANDCNIAIWSFKDGTCFDTEHTEATNDVLLSTLRDFVSYKTVSSRPEYAEDCRKGATFLGTLFKRLGGQVELLSSEKHANPVVYAKFAGKKDPAGKRKRILFYGHYDVVAADNNKGTWNSDPFSARGADGFLYGRGVSDNKGPIIAALFAVTDLMQAQKLENDVIFLIEGEEEFGSRGFEQTVRRNKERIGPIDYVLLANSYWLDEDVPCLTYGLRGVLHATVCVNSSNPDMHSGVDGSFMVNEPLSDLTSVLSKLKGPGNRVQIPGFYDGIVPVAPQEDELYDDIVSTLMRRNKQSMTRQQLKQSLMARWREPNLTIHRYKVSGPDGSLVSSHASAHISFRLVPGQEVSKISSALETFIEDVFYELDSKNDLGIQIDNRAESWLGDPTNAIFRTLEEAVLEAWPECFERRPAKVNGKPASPGTSEDEAASVKVQKPRKPLYIREGGSIPAIRFLEKEFGAEAAHLPCGRASDAAHLDNERMSLMNLQKAREIFGKVFARL